MGTELHDPGGGEEAPRSPEFSDLTRLCAELNRLEARYLVVGGFAIIHHGYPRLTNDIDLLIESTPENEARVFRALLILPDHAAAELKPGEVDRFGVVRVGDEVIVDLMKSACGVTYADAAKDRVVVELDGVLVPFASPQTLWRMKQTVRAKDIPDRLYLVQWHEAHGVPLDPPLPAFVEDRDDALIRAWRRVKKWWRKR